MVLQKWLDPLQHPILHLLYIYTYLHVHLFCFYYSIFSNLSFYMFFFCITRTITCSKKLHSLNTLGLLLFWVILGVHFCDVPLFLESCSIHSHKGLYRCFFESLQFAVLTLLHYYSFTPFLPLLEATFGLFCGIFPENCLFSHKIVYLYY